MSQGSDLVIGNIADLPVFRITSLVFPTSFFATEALLAYESVTGLLYLMAMIALSLIAVGAFYLIGNAIYFYISFTINNIS